MGKQRLKLLERRSMARSGLFLSLSRSSILFLIHLLIPCADLVGQDEEIHDPLMQYQHNGKLFLD